MVKSKSRRSRQGKASGTMDAIAALVCSILGILAIVLIVTKWETMSTVMKVVTILLVLGGASYFLGMLPGVGMLGNWSCVLGPAIALLLLNSDKLGGQGTGGLWF